MISIVIVSHSAKVAEGAVEIASEMNMGGIKLLAAGGTEDGRVGTSAEKIMNAITEAYSGDDVLVFADIGSSILSTEMAVEMLDPEVAAHVKLVDAPVVEGAVIATIQAGITESAEEIIQAAVDSKNHAQGAGLTCS